MTRLPAVDPAAVPEQRGSGYPEPFRSAWANAPSGDAFYPDDDLMWGEDENGVFAAHKDGRRY